MRVSSYAGTLMMAIAGVLGSPAAMAAQPWFRVEIILPTVAIPGQQSIQSGGGWPLVIKATSPKGAPSYNFNGANDLSYLATVASDPSGCFDIVVLDPSSNCLQSPPSEAYLRYSIDTDRVGQGDAVGDSSIRAGLVDSAGSGPPTYLGMDQFGAAVVYPVGPPTGAEIPDGIGYGVNDDWPGLVLLSNRGVGVVLDEHFDRTALETRRNLAGMLEWSSFELSNGKGQTTISAGATVPFGLLAPVIVADGAVGQATDRGEYVSPIKYRIDGGTVVDGPYGEQCLSDLYPTLAYATDLELRAFTVDGTAPGTLSDGDGDGDVDATDAELAGYAVSSSESVIHVRLWGEYFGRIQVSADLDGNSVALAPNGCDDSDLGPGKIKAPPF